jgi:hypothetical protein
MNNNPIPLPTEWDNLEAPGTRFELMYHLFEIKSETSLDMDAIVHFFYDDLPFLNGIDSLSGKVFFSNEMAEAKNFAECLRQNREEVILGNIAPSVREGAAVLYGAMRQSGDPHIELYLR